MEIQTHGQTDAALCGRAIELREGYSRVLLDTTSNMGVDSLGLVHGGFIFGLADYAAMIAVNHPNVALGGAEVKFLKPVRVGESVIAEATTSPREGKKQRVSVRVTRGEETVFEGAFVCFVLEKHVLAP